MRAPLTASARMCCPTQMEFAQVGGQTAPVTTAPKAPVNARLVQSTAPLLQRCGADCGCRSCTGADKVTSDDVLAQTLRTAVASRALQRAATLEAPAGLLQRACSATRLSQLQSQMHGVCDSGISCRRASDCDDVNDRMQAGYECYDLREQIQSECYDNQTDAGHAEQLQNVQNAIDGCVDKWNRWRCR
jgi:hypothetical protein